MEPTRRSPVVAQRSTGRASQLAMYRHLRDRLPLDRAAMENYPGDPASVPGQLRRWARSTGWALSGGEQLAILVAAGSDTHWIHCTPGRVTSTSGLAGISGSQVFNWRYAGARPQRAVGQLGRGLQRRCTDRPLSISYRAVARSSGLRGLVGCDLASFRGYSRGC